MTKVSRLEATKTRLSSPASSWNRFRNVHAAKATNANICQNGTASHKARKTKSVNDRYRDLRHKAKELGIVVQQTKFCINRPGNVPIEHQAKFEHIQTLGRLAYDPYGLQPNPDTVDKPWQLANKLRAARLNKIAINCREERLNEGGWRARVEYRLFERFEIEVACKHCRKRLWKSEIEVDPAAGNSRTSSLKERQARREPCKCGYEWSMSDIHDTGLSDIFSSRIEESNILHHDQGANFDPVRKKPDRIHGLQSTANLENLLRRHCDAQSQQKDEPSKRLLDIIQTTCNPDSGGKSLLFPFLVMEAKSEKGGSNFDEIEVQTALPIRNLLMLQHELQHAECNKMEVPGGPLAWFLADVGETWRVYGCYVTWSEDEPHPSWNIVLLWEGSITGLDEALQLVLIVDYILDWARDIYRPSILRQLKCVVARGVYSDYTISHDPDMFSVANPTRQWLSGSGGLASVPTTDSTTNQAHFADEDDSGAEEQWKLPLYKDSVGSVKHGTVLESRVRGLYITVDNMSTILQGFGDSRAETWFMSSIVKIIMTRGRCFMLPNARALSTVEQIWTGDRTYSEILSSTSCPTLVSLQVRFWVGQDWELVRELTYLAITEEAFKDLTSLYKHRELDPPESWKCAPVEQFVSLVDQENRAYRDDFFIRCLERQVLLFRHTPRMEFRYDARLTSSIGPVGQLVSSIYTRYRIGNRKPTEAFIRHCDTTENILPKPGNPLWSANDNGILVSGDSFRLCLYVTNKEQLVFTSSRVVKNLASRFALDEQIFHACLADENGILKASQSKRRDWSTQCRLGSDPGGLVDLAMWIIEIRKSRVQLMEMRSEFSSIDMFDKFMKFEEEVRERYDCSWLDFSWS
ncbi:uncharacterized protein K460DRAFT_363850 [Cucurbitaria berberidis CBS 394.84]|uniref:Uncharacterized protein n=1 Tax=Cucurbitaria berberidis CBS 394.84 TaxID=1168544 RepID=A0A9P4GMB6_9PLEO|nr:uncharacterized protein K460DRAFT_363850 [Cucurbitaria berberidis CBS 394.84]KAF1847824.1 hypothetical protein K460DRAFT_363850 [Cucurbitaria berberidis CBS 394.84]